MKKTTLIMVALFAAALAWYLLVERRARPPEERALEAKRLFHFEPKEIASLKINRPDGAVRLERSGGEAWRMTVPVAARADGRAADAAAGTLARLEQSRVVTNERGAAGLEEMGLSKPRATVTFTLVSPEPTTVEFGSEVPSTNSAFLRIVGRDEIYLAPASSVDPFLMSPYDYRDRALLTSTILDIGEVRVGRPEGELRFRRRQDDWWIEAPLEDLAEGSAVQSLVSGVIGIRAETFADKEDPSVRYGLDPPRTTVRLFSRTGEEIGTVALGEAPPGTTDMVFARVAVPGSPSATASVSGSGLAGLAKPPSEFRARHAIPFSPWEATVLKITSPGEVLTFEKVDGLWSLSSPPGLKVDPGAIDQTLQALSDLEIISYDASKGIPAPSLGLDPPKATIEVRLGSAGGQVRALELGAIAGSPNVIYARTAGRPGVVTVSSAILDRAKGGAALYESRPVTNDAGISAAPEAPGRAGGKGP